MLYTKKGDSGTTKTLNGKARISKNAGIAEALGSLDEVNSFLGICKVKAAAVKMEITGKPVAEIVHGLQETLFIVQAELAGSEMTVAESRVHEIENLTDQIEKMMPPITSFSIAGGTELSAFFDMARTMARRAERRVVGVKDERVAEIEADPECGQRQIGQYTMVFLNRLSSLIFALARLSNHISGINDAAPKYNKEQ